MNQVLPFNLPHVPFLLVCFVFSNASYAQIEEGTSRNIFLHKQPKPIEYIENKGQWTHQFFFRASLPAHGMVYLQSDGMLFDFEHPDDAKKKHEILSNPETGSTIVRHHAWKFYFEGCNRVIPVGQQYLEHYYNYFPGRDTSRWKNFVHPASEVLYQNLWDGIDLRVYSKGGQFKYEFIVHPGADYHKIKIRQDGLDAWHLTEDELHMKTSVGDFVDGNPITECQKNSIPSHFQMVNDIITFELQTEDDKFFGDLIIDPSLMAATFIGSTNGDDCVGGLSVPTNNEGIVLSTYAATDSFPITIGAFDVTFNAGDTDLGICRFDNEGVNLLWATYLGGSQNLEANLAMLTNQNGNICLAGYTSAGDFPVSAEAFDSILSGNRDVFISTLSANGAELLASTYVGGSSVDGGRPIFPICGQPGLTQARAEIEQRLNGNFVIATSAYSNWLTDYGAEDFIYTSYGGSIAQSEIYVFEMDPQLSQILWVTRIGGEYKDNICDMKILSNGNIAICGSTTSTQMFVPAGSFQENYSSNAGSDNFDGYIAIFSPDGQVLLASTYFGAGGQDEVQFIEEDTQGNIIVAGMSDSDWLASPGVYSNQGSFQFVSKFDLALQNQIWFAPVGAGNGCESVMFPSAFLVDKCDRIYLCCNANSGDILDLPLTDDALYTSGGFYLSVFSPEMAALEFATYMGGDHIHGGASRYDSKGVVYQAVCSFAAGYPFQALPNAYAPVQVAEFEAAAFKIDFESEAVVSSFTYVPVSICLPYTIEFSNWSDSAAYSWNFGDGIWHNYQDSTITYTFETAGDYLVQLAAFNINSCNIHDTSKVMIHIPEAVSNLEMDWQTDATDLCQTTASIFAEFTGSGADSLQWTFDGEVFSGSDSYSFFANQPGEYTLQIVAFDETCLVSDTLQYTFEVGPAVQAEINVIQGASGCVPQVLVAQSLSQNADSLVWLVNDGVIENSADLIYTFTQSGEYEIALIATSDTGCVSADTAHYFIEIFALPEVSFAMPDTVCKEDGIITLTGGYPGGGQYSGVAVVDGTFNPAELDTGLHVIEYTITDTNGCSNTASALFMVAVCTGISENTLAQRLKVYPNPSNDVVIFESSGSGISSLRIWNAHGELILEHAALNNEKRMMVATTSWPNGTYFYECVLDVEKTSCGKFEVQN